MNQEWINESRENDSTDHSCYSLENNFVCAVVRKAYEGIESDRAGQWTVVFNTKWTQPMPMFVIAPKSQDSDWFVDFESAINAAEEWYADATAELTKGVQENVERYKAIAAQKGYKPGWVWYQVKQQYTESIANEFLPK